MKFRLARKEDLPELKIMYKDIVNNMYENGINIWNDYYPYEEFSNDIDNNNLYVLVDNNEIVCAFALFCSDNDYGIDWSDKSSKVLYFGRIGVNIKYLRKGIGSIALNKAMDIARDRGYEYLRLMVVDCNRGAIEFYLKNGFNKVDGYYIEDIGDSKLTEYGFEIQL